MLSFSFVFNASLVQAGRIETPVASRSRSLDKSHAAKLRWQPYRSGAKSNAAKPEAAETEAAADEKHATASDDAALTRVVKPAPLKKLPIKKTTQHKSRAERHAEAEARHIAQTSAHKPKDDPFADPFFEENEKPKLKVEPIVAQPEQPKSGAADPFNLPAEENPTEPSERPAEEMPEGVAPEEPSEESSTDDDTLEQQIAQGNQGELAPCPSPNDLKKIRQITTDISAQAGEFPPECRLTDIPYRVRMYEPTMFHWKASALCSKPLYFQQAALERYGHSFGPLLQPFISGALFYATFPILPYKMGVDPPCECVYTLGWYRPGSCAPKMIYPIPISLRGGLLEAGAVLGAVFLVP